MNDSYRFSAVASRGSLHLKRKGRFDKISSDRNLVAVVGRQLNEMAEYFDGPIDGITIRISKLKPAKP